MEGFQVLDEMNQVYVCCMKFGPAGKETSFERRNGRLIKAKSVAVRFKRWAKFEKYSKGHINKILIKLTWVCITGVGVTVHHTVVYFEGRYFPVTYLSSIWTIHSVPQYSSIFSFCHLPLSACMWRSWFVLMCTFIS